jgi:cytoskeletal protein CcmA (bactofilin family)
MFGKKHTKLEVIVGPDSTLRGELSSKGTVRIDGILEGNITADCIIIGETGTVEGDVVAKSMIVAGKIRGNIRASESVEIQQKGEITGDIYTPRLVVAEGGMFEGRSIMQKNREIEFRPAELIQ